MELFLGAYMPTISDLDWFFINGAIVATVALTFGITLIAKKEY